MSSARKPPTMPTPDLPIHTPNLTLRPPLPTDAPALAALFSNPLNSLHEPRRPSNPTAAEYEQRIGKWDALRASGQAYFLVITQPMTPAISQTVATATAATVSASSAPDSTPADDHVIGFGGVNSVVAGEAGRRSADVGVMIDSGQWRKGYGREALAATFEFAFGARDEGGLGCAEVFLETLAANEPFQALMERMGLGPWKRVKSDGQECEYRFSKGDLGGR